MKLWHRMTGANVDGWHASVDARKVEVLKVERGRFAVFGYRDGRIVVTRRKAPHYPSARLARDAGELYLRTGVLDGVNLDALPLAEGIVFAVRGPSDSSSSPVAYMTRSEVDANMLAVQLQREAGKRCGRGGLFTRTPAHYRRATDSEIVAWKAAGNEVRP